MKYTNLLILLFPVFSTYNTGENPKCICSGATEVPLSGGNFEGKTIPEHRVTYHNGESFLGWRVSGHSVDHLSAKYPRFRDGNPNAASQFIDIHGFAPGGITTTLSNLEPGTAYMISLWYAKNPHAAFAVCDIKVADGDLLNSSWTTTRGGDDLWQERCFQFVARSSVATLSFVGYGPKPEAGMLLDDIRLWKCTRDAAMLAPERLKI